MSGGAERGNGGRPPSPVIVVPGITASDLHDEYELPPEAVWTTVRRRRYERITLHPEGRRYELREPARVAPRGPFPLVYGELIEELRDGLSEDQAGPVPVFPFGYDWRLPLDLTEERLAEFVREVIDRTLLMKHYRESAFAEAPAVSLIGHSMGGLIIAGHVERHAGASVDKVVTVGSPFRGSHEAILKVTTGTSDLGDDSGKARERRMARLTPSLYHLLPGYAGALAVDDGLRSDIFHPDAWQPNVPGTISRQVEEWDIAGPELFREMLDEARTHRDRISALVLREPGDAGGGDHARSGRDAGSGGDAAQASRSALTTDDWLAIAGVDAETRVALRVRRGENGLPRFDLRSAERRNGWGSEDERGTGDSRRDTGDGTVPLAGAIPPFLDESRIVCVTPGDFGYWELRDRTLARVAGFHGLMPRMNMLHRLVVRFLLEKDDAYGNTWGRRVPGAADWRPPLSLREKR